MGLFTQKVHVNVHGGHVTMDTEDGRYDKQVKKKKKLEKLKIKKMVLEKKSPAELRGFIESKYEVEELPSSDDRFKRAYLGIKSHLVEEYRPDLLKETDLEMRYQEAIHVKSSDFPMKLHVYSIPIHTSGMLVAWLEVYVETEHEYLAFKPVKLEYEEHYSIQKVKTEIVNFFGAGKEDKKKKNERYLQYVSVQ